MSFLTEQQRAQMVANGQARVQGAIRDPYPVVKLYTPDGPACWLLTEVDADGDIAYGLTDAGTGFPELGHVSLLALGAVLGPKGRRIAVDPRFQARQSLSAYLLEAQRDGAVSD